MIEMGDDGRAQAVGAQPVMPVACQPAVEAGTNTRLHVQEPARPPQAGDDDALGAHLGEANPAQLVVSADIQVRNETAVHRSGMQEHDIEAIRHPSEHVQHVRGLRRQIDIIFEHGDYARSVLGHVGEDRSSLTYRGGDPTAGVVEPVAPGADGNLDRRHVGPV